MVKETVDLRHFLGTVPAYASRQVLRFAYNKGIHVRGFSRMRKAELIEAICQRLDEPEIFKGVINWLQMWVGMDRYTL